MLQQNDYDRISTAITNLQGISVNSVDQELVINKWFVTNSTHLQQSNVEKRAVLSESVIYKTGYQYSWWIETIEKLASSVWFAKTWIEQNKDSISKSLEMLNLIKRMMKEAYLTDDARRQRTIDRNSNQFQEFSSTVEIKTWNFLFSPQKILKTHGW